MSDGTKLLTGRDYIHCVHARYNVLYSKARGTRGRLRDTICRNGCAATETLNHISQVCWSTHKTRIKRHDAISNYLCRSAAQRGFTPHVEEKFQTPSGNLKPDLGLYREDRVVVVDTQVINDQFPLQLAHKNKVDKYDAPLRPLLFGLRAKGPYFTSFTISWRTTFVGPLPMTLSRST